MGITVSASDIQRQLGGSNLSDDDYRLLLADLLRQRDLRSHIQALQGNDLQEFVDRLDNVGKVDTRTKQR